MAPQLCEISSITETLTENEEKVMLEDWLGSCICAKLLYDILR